MCNVYIAPEALLDPIPILDGDIRRSGRVFFAEVPYPQRATLIDKLAPHVRGWISMIYNGVMERYYIS